MNPKQLVILLVLLAALCGGVLLLRKGGGESASSSSAGAGAKLLGDKFPLNDVAQITIKEGTNELNLAKTDEIWRVRERDDYPANFSMISEFLIKASNLKVVQTEQIGPSQLGRLELAPPGQGTNSGVVLELKDKAGKSLKTLTLGKTHSGKPSRGSPYGDEGFPNGRYVMISGNAKDVLVVADPMSTVQAKPGSWLNKDFFKVERPKAVSVAYASTNATNSWKLTKEAESGAWVLAEAKPDEVLDTNKIYGATAPFSSPSFDDVLPKSSKPEDSGLDQPTVVTVETYDDFEYTVKVGKKSAENYPITIAVASHFPKDRSQLPDEKPEDKEKADKAFADRQKVLEDKLKQTKAFEGRTYLVSGWSLDQLLKERKDLLVEKKEEPKTDAAAGEKKDEAKPADATSGEKKDEPKPGDAATPAAEKK